MSRRSRFNRQRNRLYVTHFSYQDYVRVLTQGAAEGGAEALGVESHFTVVHDTTLTLMYEFDGVFYRDDMVFSGAVCLVDDGREGRRLSAARRARHQDEPPREGRKFRDDRRKTQLGTGQDLGRDLPEDGADAVLLLEEIGPVSCKSGDLVSKVDVPRLFELLDLVFRRYLIEHRLQFVVVEDIVLHPLHFPADSQHGLLAGDEVEVRCPLLVHQLEKGIDLGHGLSPSVRSTTCYHRERVFSRGNGAATLTKNLFACKKRGRLVDTK